MFIVVFSYIYLLYACRCWNRGGLGGTNRLIFVEWDLLSIFKGGRCLVQIDVFGERQGVLEEPLGAVC